MTTFSSSISGVVPLSNIYETPNVVHQTPPPSSWVDMLFPQIHTGSDTESNGEDSDSDDDSDTPESVYDDIPGYGAPIEGMKGKKKKKRKGKPRTGKDDAKRLFKKVLNGIKKGIDIFTKVSYFIPGKVDKLLTKLTTKATDSIYNASDKKPATTTKQNMQINEQALRGEFNTEQIITTAEEIFKKITDKLNTANNTEAFKTKNVLNDDFQSFIYKIRDMNVSTVNGEDAYKNLMLSIRSIELKLNELYGKANTAEITAGNNELFNELGTVLNPKKFLKYSKDKSCSVTNKRVHITEDFVGAVENFTKKVSSHLNKFQQIGAEPHIKDYNKLTSSITKLYYVNPLKFKSKINEIKKMYNRMKTNSSYYVFDSEIKELTKVAEEFRFEKNATEKTLKNPPDNSKLEADKRNDASIFKKVIYMFMAVPFLIIATYNWYYLIVYRDSDQFADVPSYDGKEPRAVNDKTQIKWDFSGLGPIADVADHLFGSLIFPTRLLNRILLEHKSPILPGFFSDKHPLISRACVLGLFAFLIYGMFFKVSLKELIKSDSKCKPKQNNLVVKLFMGLIIFYYVFRMLFIFFGGSHTGGFMSTLADNMAVRPLNFGFKPFLSRPILAIILFILLMVGLFFIAMLSVNMSIMIVMMYLVLHSLFGFYMYLPTTGSDGRGLFKDIFTGLSYYRDTWSKLSNIFDGERKEWKDLQECEGSSALGKIMIYVMGRVFTWFWLVIILVGIIFTLVKSKLNEMKVFTSIMIAILGGMFMYISWRWEAIMNAIFRKKETGSTAAGEATTSAATASPPTQNPLTQNINVEQNPLAQTEGDEAKKQFT